MPVKHNYLLTGIMKLNIHVIRQYMNKFASEINLKLLHVTTTGLL